MNLSKKLFVIAAVAVLLSGSAMISQAKTGELSKCCTKQHVCCCSVACKTSKDCCCKKLACTDACKKSCDKTCADKSAKDCKTKAECSKK